MDGPILETHLLDLDPRNPSRPLDWRWRLANYLDGHRDGGRRRWSDDWVRRAARFRLSPAPPGDAVQPRRLSVDPDVAGALALRSGSDAMRVVAEAGLLAGEGYDAVASRCGLDPCAVEAYERLFFAVAGVLDATDHVVFTALPGLHADEGPDRETVVKAFAFFGGPPVLDVVLHALGVRLAPPGSEPTPRDVRLTEIAVAAKRLTLARASAAGLTRLIALSEELDRRDAGAGHGQLCRPLALAVERVAGGVRSGARTPDTRADSDTVAPALRLSVAGVLAPVAGVRAPRAMSA